MSSSELSLHLVQNQKLVHTLKKIPFSQFGKLVINFNFTNRAHLPAGVEQEPEKPVEEKRAASATFVQEANKGHLAAKGRVRIGHQDTGQQVVNNLPNVDMSDLLPQLLAIGYVATHVDYFIKKADPMRKGSVDKYVMRLTLEKKVKAVSIAPAIIGAIVKLTKCVWGYVHIWKNPGDWGSIQLLHMGASGNNARHTLAVSDDSTHLVVDQFQAAVA
ncbi:MAG: hypothetical protein RLY57_762 [Candidatus Parcubacteria bacterium]|jgi:hypothetical protein